MPAQSKLSLSEMKPANAFDFHFSLQIQGISLFAFRLLLLAVVKKHLCAIIKSNATPTHVAIVIATIFVVLFVVVVVFVVTVAIVASSHSSVQFSSEQGYGI